MESNKLNEFIVPSTHTQLKREEKVRIQKPNYNNLLRILS